MGYIMTSVVGALRPSHFPFRPIHHLDRDFDSHKYEQHTSARLLYSHFRAIRSGLSTRTYSHSDGGRLL
jgi:hypothetical protein